jgi:flagellar secretion chaperone FliS
MSFRANSVSAYKETSVRTASGGKMIVMLYDEALRQIERAVKEIDEESRKYDEINNAILKAQDIITELMVSLDFEKGGDIAPSLFGLYRYFNDQLMEGNLNKDTRPLRSVQTMLTDLRSAWAQIINTTRVEGRGQGGLNVAG